MTATSTQISIARDYNIPLRLAHTVNVVKHYEYCRHMQSWEYKLEVFLDSLQDRQADRLQREMLIGMR